MRGRKPVPTKTLEKRGSWRANARKKKGEPKVDPRVPAPPPEISDAARKKWMSLVPMLEAMGTVSLTDSDTLLRYCETYVLWAKCLTALQEEGEVLETEKGYMKNPRATAYIDYTTKLNQLTSVLGLSPVDRARLRVHEPEKKKEKKSILKLRVAQ